MCLRFGFEIQSKIEIRFEIETKTEIGFKMGIYPLIVNKGRIMSNEIRFKVETLDLIVDELMDLYEEVQVESQVDFSFDPDFDLPVGMELSF